jgi:hypothetical protein
MAPWLGDGHPDDAAEAAKLAAVRHDVQDLQRIARATRESVADLLAAHPAWLNADTRTALSSIENMCNVLVGPSGRALRLLDKARGADG